MLWITGIPSPYRVDFFNELGKYYDLQVLFELKSSDERDESWKNFKFDCFEGVFLKGIKTGISSAFSLEVTKYIKNKDIIFVHGNSTLTSILSIFYMKLHKIPYYLEMDGGFAKDGKGIKEKIKKLIIPGAKGYFSSGEISDNYYVTYGADKDKLIRYPFTSIYNEDIINRIPNKEDKDKLREKLNIKEKYCVISVGRFSYLQGYGKGYDTLMRTAEIADKNIGWYIIGDEPTDEFVRWKNDKNLDNVHFVSFLQKKELNEYYLAADLSIILTRGDVWGLVVNEAFSKGLPVISSDKCAAGLEMIKNDYNGYVIPVDNPEKTKEFVDKILFNEELRKQMSFNCLETIKEYTIENMANTHIERIKNI